MCRRHNWVTDFRAARWQSISAGSGGVWFQVFFPGQCSTAFCGAEHQKKKVDEPISQILEGSVAVVRSVLHKRFSERVPQQGGDIEVSKISSQDRVLQRTVELALDESVVALWSVSHQRVQQQTAEHIMNELLPQNLEESVKVVKSFLESSFRKRFVDRAWTWTSLRRRSQSVGHDASSDWLGVVVSVWLMLAAIESQAVDQTNVFWSKRATESTQVWEQTIPPVPTVGKIKIT